MKKLFFAMLILSVYFLTGCGERVYKAKIETEFGNIELELFNSTPLHRDNFIKLVKEGYYDDLLFHRVMNDFMVQGGDPQSKDAPLNRRLGAGNPGYTIPAEIGALHYRGALAAARLGGSANPMKESSGSQFYLVQGKKQLSEFNLKMAVDYHKRKYTPEETDRYMKEGGYPALDNNYTVFGRITAGLDVLDRIAAVETNQMDRPLKDVKMKIRIIK